MLKIIQECMFKFVRSRGVSCQLYENALIVYERKTPYDSFAIAWTYCTRDSSKIGGRRQSYISSFDLLFDGEMPN